MDPDPSAPGGGAAFRIDLMTRRYEEVRAGVMALAGQEAEAGAGAGATGAGAVRAGAGAKEETEPWFGLQVVVAQVRPPPCVASFCTAA